MHKQRLPSFFLMNRTGDPHGDLLGQKTDETIPGMFLKEFLHGH